MKKSINLLFATILLLAVVPLLSATTTLNNPADDTNHSSTLTNGFNCSTDLANAMNASLWYNASGVSDTLLVTVDNDSVGDTEFTQSSVSVSSLSDSKDYYFWCQVVNSTGSQENSSLVTGVTVDSSNPTCSIDIDGGSHVGYKDLVEVTWSSADGVELISTAVSIDGPEDYETTAYTDSSRTVQLTSQDTKYVGDWTATITATDRAGNTCEDEVTFKTYLGESEELEVEKTGKEGLWIILIVIVVGIAMVAGKRK